MLCSLRYSAAFSSAPPPISPISTIPCVSGSLRNTSKQSTKLVPLKGSPPIPGNGQSNVSNRSAMICFTACYASHINKHRLSIESRINFISWHLFHKVQCKRGYETRYIANYYDFFTLHSLITDCDNHHKMQTCLDLWATSVKVLNETGSEISTPYFLTKVGTYLHREFALIPL